MANIYELARQFKADLMKSDRAALAELISAYGDAWQSIQANLDSLLQKMAQARAAGQPVGAAWLFQEERLRSLLFQVEEQIGVFARKTDGVITQQQRQAVEAAQQHTRQLTLAGLGTSQNASVNVSWNMLPDSALKNLIGTLGDGSPLAAILDTFGPNARKAINKALVTGVAVGQNPRQIARNAQQDMGGDLVRAMTICRTETLRSYRQASLQSYRANEDVLDGWVWTATLSRRTCAACLAMHGTIHPLDEEFGSHPNCRCTPVPLTKSWADLGIEGVEETRANIQPGPEWFEKQPEETQQQILGPAKFAAYQAGRIDLEDLVGYKNDPQWGPSRWENSLKDAEQAAQQKSENA